MKILHTSDWHLGRALYGQARYEEFQKFLDWLVLTINKESIDVLLIAGDVFDTTSPSNRAQKQYYQFLCQIAASDCRHVVVIGGNHDSPTFLEAPKTLLATLNVHVVGAISDDIADEIIVLKSDHGIEAIVCAVPYLRDRDLRQSEAGENIDDKNAKLVKALKQHYLEVCEAAKVLRDQYQASSDQVIPLIGMGHLFTAGGKTTDDDGVRDLYIGTLAHVGSDIFPAYLDYVALGHLHVPQIVAGKQTIRYCGSPIAMGFGEAHQQKMVICLEFDAASTNIETIPVPRFQRLEKISGDLSTIKQGIARLKEQNQSIWLEIEYTGNQNEPTLVEEIESAIENSELYALRIRNRQVVNRVLQNTSNNESLDDIDVKEVFKRRLDGLDIEDEEKDAFFNMYQEILIELAQNDSQAE